MAGGILSRFATTATPATTASSKMSTWIVEIIGAPRLFFTPRVIAALDVFRHVGWEKRERKRLGLKW